MHRIDPVDTVGVMNLASLDLNLLVTLDAVLEQRSVSRAAEQLGLSQPAVSAQLARLRRHFGDDLLARFGNQYRLTPLASPLRGRVRTAVTGVERVFAAEPDFTPANTSREFSLVMSDYGVAIIGPLLAAELAVQAPQRTAPVQPEHPVRRRQCAAVDDQCRPTRHAARLHRGPVPPRPLHATIGSAWCRPTIPDVGEHLTVDHLRTLPWVVVLPRADRLDPRARQMRMLGIEPRVQVVTESFLTVPGLVAGTPRVALLQRRLAARIPAELGLRVLPCPFEVAPLVEAIWWHPMYDDDPEHRYLRDLLVDVAARLPSD